jgi:hypothetical protein
MSPKPLCLWFVLSVLFPLIPLPAQSADWVTASDRRLDPDIIAILDTADFEQSLEIMRALGKRDEPFAGDIMLHLYAAAHGPARYKYAALLETLLSSLFAPSVPEAVFGRRYSANRSALQPLITDIPHIKSPGLKRELISIITRAGDDRYRTILAAETEKLAGVLRVKNGNLDIETARELLTLLHGIEKLRITECVDQCNAVARYANNRDLVKLARKVAAALLR